ncbi:hypothetical protein C1646_771286 [Rhizophagus diaphanus]|nr:hypothetical protein C1646_771286 [Rhizophagus diaphanus] [Rhizophagus sp. MUCL 43196]
MSQYLPIGNYKWEYSDEFLKDPENNKKVLNTILKKRKDASRGYCVQIKCHFPPQTHDYLMDLPPAVENIKVKREQLSPKQEKYLEKMGKKNYISTEKLITNLGPRDEYVLHYSELQYYVKLGIVVDEIQKVLSFDQSQWLEPYITLNSNLRKNAKTILRGTSSIGVHMGKSEIILNKPILVGAAVLGLSKLHMYKFWVETEDIYQDMIKNADLFDFNNYPSDYPLVKSLPKDQWIIDENGERTLKNAGVIGKFKDECPEYIMSEFFGPRAKLYHYVLENGSVGSRHKGVSKMGMKAATSNIFDLSLPGSLLSDSIPEDEQIDPMTLIYRNCLFEDEEHYAKNVGFRTKNHIISLVEIEKKALHPLMTNVRYYWTEKYTFPVHIDKNSLVSDLKEVIKAKKQNDFTGVDADKLKLWNTEKLLKKHIHVLVKPPSSTSTSDEVLELREKLAAMQALLNKSVHAHESLKSTETFYYSIRGLKNSIREICLTPALENDRALLNVLNDDGKYFPRNTPLKPFNEWTFPKVCELYGLSNDPNPIEYRSTGRILGVIKVKKEDFMKGFAQASVQMESTLTRKRKVNEINNGQDVDRVFGMRPNDKVVKVLGHIVWLLEEAQKPKDVGEELREIKRAKSSTNLVGKADSVDKS